LAEGVVDLGTRHVGAGEMHHGLQAAILLGGGANLQSLLRRAAAGTPRHINPLRLERGHAIESLEQVDHALCIEMEWIEMNVSMQCN
jgi:hypothetical protein